MQNVTAKVKGYRDCFTALEGKDLVIADYSNQEARIASYKSGDEVMMDTFINGDGDLHSKVASLMFNKPVHKQIRDKKGNIVRQNSNLDLRDMGKKINFTILFGGGASKIAAESAIPLKEAQKLIDLYFNQFKKLKIYLDNETFKALSNGYIVLDDYTNRRYYLKNYQYYKEVKNLQQKFKLCGWPFPRKVSSWIRRYEGDIDRMTSNYPIQSSAASMTKIAVNSFTEWIIENNYIDIIKIVNVVHDEIIIECDKALSSKVSSVIKTCMEDAGKLFTDKMIMVAEPKITEWWNH